MDHPEQIDIQPLVRMIIAGVAGVDAQLAVPALQAALCEVVRAQFGGDSNLGALAVIESTMHYYRAYPEPLKGLTVDATPNQETH